MEPVQSLDSEFIKADLPKLNAWIARSKRPGKNAPDLGPKPIVRRITVDETTLEKQIAIHADNPRGLIRTPDELSMLLGSFGQYKKGSNTDRPQWDDWRRR